MKPLLPESRCALPAVGLLALVAPLVLYPLSRAGLLSISPSLLGLILILTGAIQVSAGLSACKQGNQCASAALIPLGLFWMTLLGFYIFPALGLALPPSAVAMTSYLTMWGFFVAILYLGSFRQSRIIQLLFGSMMICFLSLGLAEIRENPVFFYCAAITGTCSAVSALYAGIAQVLNQRMQRTIMPLGRWQADFEDGYDEQVSS